jgi:hypothetical protein
MSRRQKESIRNHYPSTVILGCYQDDDKHSRRGHEPHAMFIDGVYYESSEGRSHGGSSIVSSLSGAEYDDSSFTTYSVVSSRPTKVTHDDSGDDEEYPEDETSRYTNTMKKSAMSPQKSRYDDDSTYTTAQEEDSTTVGPSVNSRMKFQSLRQHARRSYDQTSMYGDSSTAIVSAPSSYHGKAKVRHYTHHDDDSTAAATAHEASRSGESTNSRMKFESLRQEARRLARMGQNVRVQNHFRLPAHMDLSEICVQVQIDPRARAYSSDAAGMLRYPGSHWKFEERIKMAVQDELQTIYTCNVDDDPLFLLEVVIVSLTDGSVLRTLRDSEGVLGLAELACVWHLHVVDHPDEEYFEGGLSVEYEDIGYGISDIFKSNGEECLLKRLAPRMASRIVSRIGECSDVRTVEI